MPPAQQAQLLWLVLLCSPPVVLALILAIRRQKGLAPKGIRIGNPMFRPEAPPPIENAVLRPLLHLTRIHSDFDLRALVLGLRHMPLNDTAFILRRYQKSPDPELQLFSQGILQAKLEELQNVLARLLPLATEERPAILASCIETGLRIVSSPLTAGPERDAVLRKLAAKASLVRDSGVTHPRAVFAAAHLCIVLREIGHADELTGRLPQGSPFRHALSALLGHHAAIQHPPPVFTSRYVIR